MNHNIKDAFGSIHADEALKQRTKTKLSHKTNSYSRRKAAFYRPLLAAAACVLFALTGYWFYFTPTAQISIDINPSIELAVNRLDRVVTVKGYNEDGIILADTLDVRFGNYAEAIEHILKNEQISALLSDNEVMTITVVGSAQSQCSRILTKVEQRTSERQNTYCYAAHSQDVAAAHDEGLSYGKYRAFLELQRLDPDITTEAVQEMTMREIQDCIHSHTRTYADEDNISTGKHKGHEHHGSENNH